MEVKAERQSAETTLSETVTPPRPEEGHGDVGVDLDGLTLKDEGKERRSCAICPKPGLSHCQKCCKVNYCSREHQLLDWKTHRPDCFPFETRLVTIHGEEGRYMFATRDLAQGEKIHKENAFLQGPKVKSSDYDYGEVLCIGCSTQIELNQPHAIVPCSKCMWNMCERKCEKIKMHAEFECKLFQKLGLTQNRVNLRDTAVFYDTITVLRIILLKEKDKAKFDLIIGHIFTPIAERELSQDDYSTTASIKFFREKCLIAEEDFSDDMLNHLFKIVRANCLAQCEVSPGSPSQVFMSIFFENTQVYAPNCVANMRWGIGAINGIISIRTGAAVAIKKGEMLSGEFTHYWTGTLIRRKVILDMFYHICQCERCRDPTELGTYVSAMKCQALGCVKGYCLQIEPLIPTSDFKCDKCDAIMPREKVVAKTVELTAELVKADPSLNKNPEPDEVKNQEPIILELEKLILNLSGNILHPNHFLISKTTYAMASHLINFAAEFGPTNVKKDMALRVVEYCKTSLKLTDVLFPGESRMRARLLYNLQLAFGITILGPINEKITAKKLTETVRRYRLKSMEELLAIQEECKKILEFEPGGTEESFMSDLLNQQMQETHDVIHTLKFKAKKQK